jgi:hypothetical protein
MNNAQTNAPKIDPMITTNNKNWSWKGDYKTHVPDAAPGARRERKGGPTAREGGDPSTLGALSGTRQKSTRLSQTVQASTRLGKTGCRAPKNMPRGGWVYFSIILESL